MQKESSSVKLDPVLLWAKFQPQGLMLLKYNLKYNKFNIAPKSIVFAALQALWSEGFS